MAPIVSSPHPFWARVARWSTEKAFRADTLVDLLTCPASLAVVALLPREWAVDNTVQYLTIGAWSLGILTILSLALGRFLSEEGRLVRIVRRWCPLVSFALLLAFALCRQIWPQIVIEWPGQIVRHEAIVGGQLKGWWFFSSRRWALDLYVCPELGNSVTCFRQNNAGPMPIGNAGWRMFARFGNETQELNAANGPILKFWVVAIVAKKEPPRFCKGGSSNSPPIQAKASQSCDAWSGAIEEFVETVAGLEGLHVSTPFEVERIVESTSKVKLTSVEYGSKPTVVDLLRPTRLFVCPPVEVRFSGNGYVEFWEDAKARHPDQSQAYRSWNIPSWPHGAVNLEVKVSESPGHGPYDSIYLARRGDCD
jgi:hypothetical protein